MLGRIKIAGLLVGLIGNGAMGYALYTLLGGAGCATSLNASACEAAMTPGMIALPVGIILSMIGIFMGGGFLVFCGLFLAIGLGSMAASAFTNMGEMQSFGWIFGGMFAFFGLLPLFLVRGLKAGAVKKALQAKRLVESGTRGVGTVLQVNDTGMTINDDPRVEIVVRVAPVDGGATVERRKKVVVPRVAIPRVGERYPVWYDVADPGDWIMGTQMSEDAPADVRDMFARAGTEQVEKPASDSGLVEELERLDALRRSDALTPEEYARAKNALLDRMGR